MKEQKITEKLEEAAEEVFSGEEVVVAYLYGSVARGEAHESSDIDVAVLFKEETEIDSLTRLSLKLEELTGLDDIEMRSLNSQKLVFVSNVIREGQVIYEGDHERRVDFEAHKYNRYLDMKPYIERYNRLRGSRMEALKA